MEKFHQDILEKSIKVINLDVTAKEYHEYNNDAKVPLFIEYDKTLKEEKLRAKKNFTYMKHIDKYFNFLNNFILSLR